MGKWEYTKAFHFSRIEIKRVREEKDLSLECLSSESKNECQVGSGLTGKAWLTESLLCSIRLAMLCHWDKIWAEVEIGHKYLSMSPVVPSTDTEREEETGSPVSFASFFLC